MSKSRKSFSYEQLAAYIARTGFTPYDRSVTCDELIKLEPAAGYALKGTEWENDELYMAYDEWYVQHVSPDGVITDIVWDGEKWEPFRTHS